MRVENKFSIGYITFEMTIAILVETENRQVNEFEFQGEKFSLDTSILESLLSH